MSKESALENLGISNPDQIDRYSLQTIHNVDILRIVYKRKKGSFLPDSKKFRFARTEKLRGSENEPGGSWIEYEVSPFVREVMAELDPIVKAKHDKSRKLELIHEELHRLEEENAHRVAYIKSLVESL